MWKLLGTTWVLEQWGMWANIPEETRLSFPSKSNFVQLQGGSLKLPDIDLDTALIVDAGVKMAGIAVHLDYEKVLVGRHVKNKSLAEIAKYFHVDRRTATETLHKAEAWLDGYLHSLTYSMDEDFKEVA